MVFGKFFPHKFKKITGDDRGINIVVNLASDSNGVIGMDRNGEYLYFEKNIFGDIISAYNSAGSTVAYFRYDGFGNLLFGGGTMAPYVKFRYRGYYYDDETGFYYLKSRYYDPSICRFISADQPELIPQLARSLGELNLYSYCANNPIMHTDANGKSLILTLAVVFGIIGAIGVGTAAGISAYNAGYRGWELAGITTIGVLFGGLSGRSWEDLLAGG